MHDDVYRNLSFVCASPLTREATPSQALQNIGFVFGILISMILFVTVRVVNVKYPFCSLADSLNERGSGRSCSILVISILKARRHQTFGSLDCINQASE